MAAPAKPIAVKSKARLVDAITLTEFLIEYEPELSDKSSVNWGVQKIMGQRLPIANWVGGGDKQVELSVYLLGASQVTSTAVTPAEIGQARMDQLANYERMVPQKVGVNPDGSDKIIYVKNPEPPPRPLTALEAKAQIQAQKAKLSLGVEAALKALEGLTQPQEDIGAPHPVMLDFGGIYTGKKFIVLDVSRKFLSYGLENQKPYEVEVKITLQEISFKLKGEK